MNLHSHTPSLMAQDARALVVRQITLHRADMQAVIEPRITRQRFDRVGRVVSILDPRREHPHTSTVYSLSGLPLLIENADAGWRLSVRGEAGQILVGWDERGSQSFLGYDESMRLTQVAEQRAGQSREMIERFTYGDASETHAAHNQCGRLVRRDDGSGSLGVVEYAVAGTVLRETRRFLATLETPDWPQALAQRDRLLEGETYLSRTRFNALSEVVDQQDARGNRQAMSQTCAGQLRRIRLERAGSESTQTLVDDIQYNAVGGVESEIAGNGVVSRYFYDAKDGRLTRMQAVSPDGQALQDLNYAYDPVGNVVSIEDAILPVSFFKNQRVEPINQYMYDSLYQLIEASGREVAPVSHRPGLPDLQPLPLDPGTLINYTQRFEYDAGGNLLARHHSGAETWRMAVSATSNRSLPQRADGALPGDDQIAEAFDGNGNLKTLLPGQTMTWDARNQLSEVTAVKREDWPDDVELYRYDGEGQRVRKVRVSQVRNRALTVDVRYLPALEIHRNNATGEMRQVLTVKAGRNSVRVLHWESGKPEGIENDQVRYSLSDHLGSSTLELDQDAKLISHEGYYPFGGTAWWAGRCAIEAKYKTVRYSGKERDATGLYYYGFRYYAPWLQRWVSPDPAGPLQDLNLYQFVGRSPVSKRELDGRVYEGLNDRVENMLERGGDRIIWRGLGELQTIDPSGAQAVRLTLAGVDQVFKGAIAAAQDSNWDRSSVSMKYFGYYHNEAMPYVLRDWQRTQALVSDYRSLEGYDKFVGIEPKEPEETASVVRNDPHGRVFLNVDKLRNSELQKTIAHEMSHLGKVSGLHNHEGSRTVDSFYLNDQFAIYLPSIGSRPDIGEVSSAVVNGQLTSTYLERTLSPVALFTEQVQALHHDVGRQHDLPAIIHEFNRSPHIASVMASRNADSVTEAAYDFYHARGRRLLAERSNGALR